MARLVWRYKLQIHNDSCNLNRAHAPHALLYALRCCRCGQRGGDAREDLRGCAHAVDVDDVRALARECVPNAADVLVVRREARADARLFGVQRLLNREEEGCSARSMGDV